MSVLLVSCYELGRQPFTIASPWAQLEAAGFEVSGVDVALDDLVLDRDHRLIAISVPMHTALRLGVALAARIRAAQPQAHICFFGMYASLNAAYLLGGHADSVIGGEFEEALVSLAKAVHAAKPGDDGASEARIPGVTTRVDDDRPAAPVLRKLPFVVPRRDGLPPLSRYATFFGMRADERRQVGTIEATRGCKHACRHCPVTAVYQGRFFVVPADVVVADAEQQIAAGARHLTFGDPDFLNGPGHTLKIARTIAAAHPDVSFDVTIKVEHIVAHPEHIRELGELGCAFVISAVESLSDEVLRRLAKGHDRADVMKAVAICREAGVALRPSFVAFTPWTTLEDYIELVEWVIRDELVDHLEPIQLAIRLLVPPGSAMLWDEDTSWLGQLDREAFGYSWAHPDPRMDALFAEVSAIVETHEDARAALAAIRAAAYAQAGRAAPALAMPAERFVPHLSESWFCCAEPNQKQLAATCGSADQGATQLKPPSPSCGSPQNR